MLGALTVEQLARVIDERSLAVVGRVPGSLAELARLLEQPRHQVAALTSVNSAELRVLEKIVELGGGRLNRAWGGLPDQEAAQDAVVEAFGAAHRDEVGAVLAELVNRVIVLPVGRGQVRLPGAVAGALSTREYQPAPAVHLLDDAFNKPELLRIAGALGLPVTGQRAQLLERLHEFFSDADRVHALVVSAPPGAAEILASIVARQGLLATHRFVGWSKYTFAPLGSGDPGTDWLADRALVIPVAPELAEAPLEVHEALRERHGGGFVPAPKPLLTVEAPAERTIGEGRAAVTTAVSRLEGLCRSLSSAPANVRKVGGLAVRDTRRLAKEIGAPDEETRLWIDLSVAAGILDVETETPPARGRRRPEPSPPRRLMPSRGHDDWLAGSPAERLAPVVAAWAHHGNIVTWWPEESDETPVALVSPDDGTAPQVRLAVLSALAALPEGQGADDRSAQGLNTFVEAVTWHRPLAVGDEHEARILATLTEARLLGVVAHGALTPLGHAVRTVLNRRLHHDGPPTADTVAVITAALEDLLPAPVAYARFQADLTAVVPGLPAPGVATLLNDAADRESEGHAVVWRFSPASVRRALDGGLDPDDLLARLTDLALDPLPQPLEYLIKDVARRHGQIKVVHSACCLRSDDEALVHELANHRALRKIGLRRIAPTVLVSAQPPAETLQALRAAGYTPTLEAQTGTAIVERTPTSRTTRTRTPRTKSLTSTELAEKLLATR
ncbi:helicase-associated domain-containing protein [Actinocorallia lasiicapitis]